MMGHLNSFLASGRGNLNKYFPKIEMPGGLPGGGCLCFDLTGTLLRIPAGRVPTSKQWQCREKLFKRAVQNSHVFLCF